MAAVVDKACIFSQSLITLGASHCGSTRVMKKRKLALEISSSVNSRDSDARN